MKRFLAAALCAAMFATGLSAQTRSFKMGQWTEIQNAILRNISKYYVDSLPVDKMYEDAIARMLSNLDPYTVFVPESSQEDFQMMISNTYGGIGAVIYKPDKDGNVIINEPYEGSPAARAGLRCGDEIMTVDSQSVVGMTASDASGRMKGKPGTTVHFKVKKVRTGQIVDCDIVREKIHFPNVEYYGMLDASTGYIYQTGFTEGASSEIAAAVKDMQKQGMKRLVLDLRGNGGGLLDEAVKIVGLFVPKGTLVVTSKGTDGERRYTTPSDPVAPALPLMVMVDSGSASASEIVSGAIQDLDRGVIAGERTFGKGLVQKVLPLVYNSQLKVTVAKYYTPSGRCVQAKDYSHRREDGSVGNIPDSLTREFKTAGGRTVRDGGGITPDLKLALREYDRITYSVAMNGIAGNYAIEYARHHDSIAPVDEFHLTDAQWEDFVNWAAEQKFDSRSEAQTYYDLMVKQLKKDKMYDDAAEALASLEKVVKMDKKAALTRSRSDIQPLVEEEIAVRYWFQAAGIKVRLRTDGELREALGLWK